MLTEDGNVPLGEWLPDLPFYNNPGLVEAKNAIPVDGNYKNFLEISTSGQTLNARPQGAFAAIDANGAAAVYAGTATDLYIKSGSSFNSVSAATYSTATNGYWRFAQFDRTVIATNYADNVQGQTVGAATAFTALATAGSAPKARQVGVINRFVMLGDTDDTANGAVPYRVEWSAIGDARNWPDPGTSTARTLQSGEQFMNSAYGAVTGIANGQFYGTVFQQRGISRFTYIGGDVVWQIQEIDRTRGLWAPQSLIQVGDISYFLSADGWYMTNGQVVTPIGNAKVDKWFYSNFDQSYRERLTSGLDYLNKCIYWAFPTSLATLGSPNRILVYNIPENRWSWGDEAVQLLFQSYTQGYTLDQLDTLFSSIDDMTVSLDSPLWSGGVPTIQGFSGGQLGDFNGDALTSTFETGEIDGNPFGRLFVRGVRPLVTGTPSSISVALSARDTQDNASRSFGMAVSRTSRTGVCDFRTQGRFLSAQLQIAGGFDRALGLAFDAEQGDQV